MGNRNYCGYLCTRKITLFVLAIILIPFILWFMLFLNKM